VRVNADRLRRARETAGLSRASLSESIDLSVASISRIENGLQMPGADILGRWASACGVTTDSLFDEEHDAA
jgi:transcriptional regulator with XRE-family HTH domain